MKHDWKQLLHINEEEWKLASTRQFYEAAEDGFKWIDGNHELLKNDQKRYFNIHDFFLNPNIPQKYGLLNACSVVDHLADLLNCYYENGFEKTIELLIKPMEYWIITKEKILQYMKERESHENKRS